MASSLLQRPLGCWPNRDWLELQFTVGFETVLSASVRRTVLPSRLS
jgi:hypothetical protein